jgi:endonuclease/exonuclease/phosphatase family metal-dependent hydrolase
MPTLKVATWNIEWMVGLFGGRWKDWDGTIPPRFNGRTLGDIRLDPIEDVPDLCARVAGVIRRVRPDVLAVQEGPPLAAQLEYFVARFLDGDYVVVGSNASWQSAYILVRQSLADGLSVVPATAPGMAALRGSLFYYPWQGFRVADRRIHRFARQPVCIDLTLPGGKRLAFVNVHLKSKFSKLKTLAQWERREPEPVLDALDVRQKVSAEVAALRRYVSLRLMTADVPDGLVTLGDFNDGPFGELFEAEFLLHNILDEMVGSFLEPDTLLRHAMRPDVLRAAHSVTFNDPLAGGAEVRELIDHILVSPRLVSTRNAVRLHPASAKVEAEAMALFTEGTGRGARGLRPSDHAPVSATFGY